MAKKAVKAMKIAGMTVEKYPRARPKVTLDAAPDLQLSAKALTGL